MANELATLSPAPGSRKTRMRVGRGEGSGKGKTAGRGMKGQRARNGVAPAFEGGQMPLHRRLPKRGFTNVFAKVFAEVRLDRIAARFPAGAVVDLRALLDAGLVSKVEKDGVKVLGNGDLGHALTIQAQAFTRSAVQKIEAAGGKAETV